ncbi:MAG: folate/biopterin family MFS transporter, partial [Cyanobacteria bacterium P01_F01_bin.42]
LIIAGLLGSAAWLYLAFSAHHPWDATTAIVVSSMAIAISDVIADSMVVERIQGSSQATAGELQSLCWSATAVGGILTAYLSGILLEYFSQRTIFAITATFPLLVAIAALLMKEERVKSSIQLSVAKQQVVKLKDALIQKSIWLPILFLFLWQATPNSESAFFFFTTNDLGFNPEFLGRVRLVTSLASLIGIWIFQRFLKEVKMRVIFLWSTLISSGLGMTALLLVTHANRAIGISDRWFSLGDSLILTAMGQLAFMPVLVLAARLCPKGIEATMFAVIMALSNLAGVLSHEFGAVLMNWMDITETDFRLLWLLVLVANLSTLLPLPLLRWLPSGEDSDDDSMPTMPPTEEVLAASR